MKYLYFDPRADHKELAEMLKNGFDLYSKLIVKKQLDESVLDKPEFVKIKTVIQASEVEEEARRRIQNSFTDMNTALSLLFEAWENPVVAGNSSTPDEDQKYKSKMLDLFFDSEIKALYPSIISDIEYEFQFEYDEDKKENILKPKEVFERDWPMRLKRALAPRALQQWERIYSMPDPISWDSRNVWEQYFFVQPKFSERVTYYCQGGSASSQQRFINGVMSHAFCLLEHQYGLKIPTYIACYDEFNRYVELNSYPSLRVINSELNSNYRVDLAYNKEHLFGRLLKLDYSQLKFVECGENEL